MTFHEDPHWREDQRQSMTNRRRPAMMRNRRMVREPDQEFETFFDSVNRKMNVGLVIALICLVLFWTAVGFGIYLAWQKWA